MRALPKGIRSDVRTCNRSPSISAFRTMCCSACSGPTRRTRSLARRRQRKTSRGVPVGAEVFCRPAAAIDQMGRPGKPPRRSRGKPRTSLILHMRQKISRGEVCSISRQNISRGRSVQCSYFIGRIRDVSLVTEGARPSSLAQEQAGGHAARLTTLLLLVVVPQRVVGDQVRLRRRA